MGSVLDSSLDAQRSLLLGGAVMELIYIFFKYPLLCINNTVQSDTNMLTILTNSWKYIPCYISEINLRWSDFLKIGNRFYVVTVIYLKSLFNPILFVYINSDEEGFEKRLGLRTSYEEWTVKRPPISECQSDSEWSSYSSGLFFLLREPNKARPNQR